MDLTTYVERLRSELGVTEAGAEAAVRLMLLDALSAAADEITARARPRLGRAAPARRRARVRRDAAPPADERRRPRLPPRRPRRRGRDGAHQPAPARAAQGRRRAGRTREGLSVNSWLVRAVAAALDQRRPRPRPPPRGGRVGQRFTGWVR